MNPQSANDTVAHAVVVPPSGHFVPDDVLQTAERLGISGQLSKVIAITRELFGDPIALRVASDPELEDWTHITVHAPATGTVEETVSKEERWCEQMVEHRLSNWFTLVDE